MKINVYTIVILATILCILTTHALPLRDSPISTFVIPYEPYTSQQIKNYKGDYKRVLVPLNMDIVPRINLKKDQIAMGQKGSALNFAEGAYPVYYMPGNANGKFNGKISLLV